MIDSVGESPIISEIPQEEPIPPKWQTLGGNLFNLICVAAGCTVFLGSRKRKITLAEGAAGFGATLTAPAGVVQTAVAYDDLPLTYIDNRGMRIDLMDIVYDTIHRLPLPALKLWGMEEYMLDNDAILYTYLHPFKFLERIFLHEHLKKPGQNFSLKKVVQDIFSPEVGFFDFVTPKKQNRFLEGVSRGIITANNAGKLFCYIEPFAKKLGVSSDKVRECIITQNWQELVVYLCKSPTPPLPRETVPQKV
ncbi:MAG: hypothetical protein HY069_05030 [Chlamydiia bacterium]|nr:hypothetical protein [Chlamydiia bacterium]